MIEFLKKIITAPLYVMVAVVVLFEDLLWDDLQRLAQYLGRLPVFHQAEALVVSLPPWGALSVFLLPSLLLVPVKLAALWFLSSGHAAMGILTMVAAKIAGTALVARLFRLTKPKLMAFRWFATAHHHLAEFKARLYGKIRSLRAYELARSAALTIRGAWNRWRNRRRSWLHTRWHALKRHRKAGLRR